MRPTVLRRQLLRRGGGTPAALDLVPDPAPSSLSAAEYPAGAARFSPPTPTRSPSSTTANCGRSRGVLAEAGRFPPRGGAVDAQRPLNRSFCAASLQQQNNWVNMQ